MNYIWRQENIFSCMLVHEHLCKNEYENEEKNILALKRNISTVVELEYR
jgi:hypothetical protein